MYITFNFVNLPLCLVLLIVLVPLPPPGRLPPGHLVILDLTSLVVVLIVQFVFALLELFAEEAPKHRWIHSAHFLLQRYLG